MAASPCGADALRLSVARINTVDADPSMGTILENLLSEELHRQGNFTLIDRKRAEMRGDAAAAGVSADKIITGSLVVQSGLLINVMAIDAVSSKVDFSVTETVSKDADFGAVVKSIADRIRSYYAVRSMVNRRIDVTAGPSVFMPLGSYADYLNPSCGGMASLTFAGIFGSGVSAYAESGVNRFFPKFRRYSGFMQLFTVCGPSLRLNPLNPLLISVRAGAGFVWTRSRYDVDGRYGPEGFDYRTRWFINPCGAVETEAALHIYDRWMLTMSGGYMVIPDRARSGRLFFLGAGLKTLL